MTRPCVATSFAPVRLDAQRRALESWRRSGFDVLSLNSREEVEKLGDAFEGVRFVTPARDSRAFMKKPYVFVYDVVRALRETESDIVGIVNSDVEIDAGEGFVSFVAEQARDALVYGSRVEWTPGSDRMNGPFYSVGYDYFFFPRRLADAIPDEPFCLGLPWWDYWFPLQFLERGHRLKFLESRVAFHETHATNYSHSSWLMFAGLMHPHLANLKARARLVPRTLDAAQAATNGFLHLASCVVSELQASSSRLAYPR